jgi:putative endonuclease
MVKFYFEVFDFADLVIKREKQIKGYSRKKKHTLIDSLNPNMDKPEPNRLYVKLT